MAGVPILSMLSVRLGMGRRLSHFQPRLTVEATHRLLVDRPALAIQEGPDPSVAVSWVRPGQFLDPSSQRRLFIANDRRVAEAGAGQVQRPRHATLRYMKLFTYRFDYEPAAGGGHGFFF